MKKTVCILTLLLISITAYSQQDKQMRNLDPGFVHTVYFWLNNPDSGDDQKQFEKAMKKLFDNYLCVINPRSGGWNYRRETNFDEFINNWYRGK